MSFRKQIARQKSALKLRGQRYIEYHWPGGWRPRPVRVSVTPTYRCNLNCQMCFQRDERGKPRQADRGELPPERWKEIIDRLAGFSSSLYWVGGEILIYPRIVELLAYACSLGLHVSFSTNGFSLARIADRVVDMGVECVVVSLDGTQQIHNRLRGHPKSFQWAVEGTQALLAARRASGRRFPMVVLSYTITNQNDHHVTEFYNFARELDVDMVQYVGLMYLSPASAQHHCGIMQSEFGVTPQGINVLCNRGHSELDAAALQKEIHHLCATVPPSPELRFWSGGLQEHITAHYGPDDDFPLTRQHCRSVSRNFVVQPNGDVTVCPFLLEMVVGNIFEQNLRAIWNGAPFRRFRRRLRSGLLPGCMRCTWAEYR